MKITQVSAGIIIDKNRVLLTRRAPKEAFAGGWEFPGGKLEAGETPQKCLTRELKEELAIDIAVGNFCMEVLHHYDTISVCLLSYYCTITKGHVSISVHDKYVWAPIDALLSYDLLPADVPIAKKIQEDML